MVDMFQPPRGTRDFLPEEMLKRNWVLDRIREVYEVYGFEPLGTPAFESWELLKVKSGDNIINQIYYFKDKSDRELGLRFEWTASLARVVSSHRELQMPFKRFAIGPVWRYENPSEAHYREFWQADADIVGVSDQIADAEILATTVDCLRSLGFKDFVIKLNDRRILEAFIELVGMPEEKALDIIRSVDKLGKIGRDGVVKELSKYVQNEDSMIKLLDLISIKASAEDVLEHAAKCLEKQPEGVKGCVALKSILDYSKPFGYYDYIVVDLTLARGLDYYTGPVFEVSAKGYEDYGSIAGGGRYDEIIGLFGGEPTPATGVALGIERIVQLLDRKNGFVNLRLGVEVLVSPVSESVKSTAIEVAQSLRKSGISTTLDLLGRGLSKQLNFADRKGIRKVIIVGEKELKKGYVTLRDMATGDQKKVKIDELPSLLAPLPRC
jgi:histidyl-tRNA synthetase